jgi:pimeloyl-ACP methyl ester carboxylesterase
VLVSSAGFGRDIGWMLRLLTLPLADRLVELATPDRVRRSLSRMVYDPATLAPELVDAVYETWKQPGNRRAFVTALRHNISLLGVRRWRQHLRRIANVRTPVLIIWGRNDRTIPVRHAYRAAKRLTGARLHIFDRCGHMPPYEHAAEFNRLLQEFLA